MRIKLSLVLAAFLLAMIIISAVKHDDEENAKLVGQLAAEGFNPKDVFVFCKYIGADVHDFLVSPSIQKQYEVFSLGESSNFIKEANSHKRASEARMQGQASGFATGIATGVAMGSIR